MATLNDVAKAAGVSLSTASNALNGKAKVKRATREKVEQVAAEIGYQKDASASVLASRQRHAKRAHKQLTLGFVWADTMNYWHNSYAAFQKRASILGYDAEAVNLAEYSSMKRAEDHLRFTNVKGLFLASPNGVPSREWLKFSWDEFSVVKGHPTWPELSFPQIRNRAIAYARMALMEAVSRGYKRIAFIHQISKSPEDDEARLGLALSMQALGRFENVEIAWRFIETLDWTEGLSSWLEAYRPDAVLGFTGSVHTLLSESGYQMPQDFAFAAINRNHDSAEMHSVSGSYVINNEIVSQGVDLLNTMIQAGQYGHIDRPVELVIEPHWYEGETLPPVLQNHSL